MWQTVWCCQLVQCCTRPPHQARAAASHFSLSLCIVVLLLLLWLRRLLLFYTTRAYIRQARMLLCGSNWCWVLHFFKEGPPGAPLSWAIVQASCPTLCLVSQFWQHCNMHVMKATAATHALAPAAAAARVTAGTPSPSPSPATARVLAAAWSRCRRRQTWSLPPAAASPLRACSTGWGSRSLGRTHSRQRWVMHGVGAVFISRAGGLCSREWVGCCVCEALAKVPNGQIKNHRDSRIRGPTTT